MVALQASQFDPFRAGPAVSFPTDFSGLPTTPTLVQKAGQRNTGGNTVTLPSVPTAGNLLVLIAIGYSSAASIAITTAGWTKLYSTTAASNQGASVWVRTPGPSEPTAIVYTASDVVNVMVAEISGADANSLSFSSGVPSVSGSTISQAVTVTANTVNLLAFDQDNAVAFSSVSGDVTLLYDATATSRNHPATFWQVFTTGTVAVTMAAGSITTPMYIDVTVGPQGGLRFARAVISSGTGAALLTRPVAGKAYWEMYLNPAVSGTPRIGLAAPGSSLTLTVQLGTQTSSVGYDAGGTVTINGITVATIMPYTTGHYIGVAVDPIADLVWFRVDGGNWNNSPTANPTTGTEGISLATLVGGAPIPAFSAAASADCTMFTTAATLHTTAPDGFTPLDDAHPTGEASVIEEAMTAVTEPYPAPLIRSALLGNAVGITPDTARIWSPATPYTTVKGVVQEEEVPVAGKKVFLHDSVTGAYLGSAISAEDGSFEIPAFGRLGVHVVALDPNYRALVYDRVVPT